MILHPCTVFSKSLLDKCIAGLRCDSTSYKSHFIIYAHFIFISQHITDADRNRELQLKFTSSIRMWANVISVTFTMPGLFKILLISLDFPLPQSLDCSEWCGKQKTIQ